MSDKIVLSDRIKELSYTVGTGNFSLEGAANGFSDFASKYVAGDTFFYAITDGTRYEIGSGVYGTGITGDYLTRFPFRSSSNDDIVSFPAGTKEVFVTYPATHAVFQGSGLYNLSIPKSSGLAFWDNENTLDYDSNIVWDKENNKLGINTNSPQHSIDIGGDAANSIIRSSGVVVGTSGIQFPANPNYDGGRQTVHYEQNQLDQYAYDNELLSHLTGSNAVLELSGVVNQYILFKQQDAGTVFAGPASGCTPPCSPAYPSFRQLVLDDFPYLEQVSGILNTRIVTVSGVFVSGSGALNDGINTVSGMFVSGSGALSNSINTVSGMLINASGSLNNNINIVSGILNIVSGISNTNITDIVGVSGDLSKVFNVVSLGGKYVFNGVGTIDSINGINPNLYLHRGLKYKFNIAATGHPLYIKTVPSTGTLNLYDVGVVNNGEDSGLLTFTVPQTSPSVLYYSCGNHVGMSGIIFTTTGSEAGDGLILNSDTQVLSLDNPSNHYSSINATGTQPQDKALLWDEDASSWKTINLDNLLYAPSGRSYIKQKTVNNTSDSGQSSEIAFDDNYVYFYTSIGWKRIGLNTFGSLTTTTSTTIAPSTTTSTTSEPSLTTTIAPTTTASPTTTTLAPTGDFNATIQSWLNIDKEVTMYFGGTPLAIIDWGDGTSNSYVASAGFQSHTYPNSGQYTLSINSSNNITELRFDSTSVTRNKIIKSINSFGDKFYPITMENFARHCSNLVSVPNTMPPSVISLHEAFRDASSLNCDLSAWDVSRVTDFSECFRGASSFNGDISTWNTSIATNFTSMFFSATAFNNNIGSWNVSSSQSFENMFSYATSFNQNIGSWDVSNVRDMSSMFYQASSFNQNISNWNITFLNSVTDLDDFMGGVTLSTANYNSLLIAWDTNKSDYFPTLRPNFGSSQCSGAGCLAKLNLINYGWTITDAEGTQS
jgi:surface protein